MDEQGGEAVMAKDPRKQAAQNAIDKALIKRNRATKQAIRKAVDDAAKKRAEQEKKDNE
jgi:hypothetical protein